MVGKMSDDWGTALGSDKDVYVPPTPKKKAPKKDSLSGLVYEFQDLLILNTPIMSLNSQINGPAMMKAFRKILETGKTYDDIRAMMLQFSKDIKAKPITDGTPLWRVFLGRLDTLAVKVGHYDTPHVYDDVPKIDPRLTEDDNG
jgi:hypothetical protein